MQHQIEDIDLKQMADSVREIAREIESGNFVAFAMVGCDQDGNASQACMVHPDKATHDLLDEMVYEIKKTLFASFEA